MIESNAKITVDNVEDGLIITISPRLAPWQTWALRIWLIVWLVLGMLGILGMISEGGSNQTLYALVFAAFWFYFIYYAGRSILWNESGREYLRLSQDSLDYKRSWGQYGRVQSFDLNTIKSLGLVNLDSKSFSNIYQNAFWTVGGEQIGFEYLGRKVVIGLRLDEADAKSIIKMIESK